MSTRPEPSVLWREGMLLCPQHLQAFGRELRARIGRAEATGRAGAFGLIALEIDDDALARDVFQVIACDAVMRDGSWLRFPESAALAPREFGAAFKGERLDVFLGVAAEQPGVPQVGDEPDRAYRYRAMPQVVADENERDSDRELEFRVLQARLFFGDEDRTGFECLRIARLERRGKPVAHSVRVDGDVPPALACAAAPALVRALEALAVSARAQARDLAQTLPSLTARAPADRADVVAFAKLQAIGRAGALLAQVAACPALHPWEAYRTLVDSIGSLAVFGPERVPPDDLPAYDHERLGECFGAALRTLRGLLAAEVTVPYACADFAADPLRENFFVAELPPEWLERRDPIWLGVECAAPPEQAIEYVATCVKILAAGDVESFLTGVVPGIELVHERVAPVALPAAGGRLYFRIEREGASRDAWLRAERQKKLALLTFLSSIGPVSFRLYVEQRD